MAFDFSLFPLELASIDSMDQWNNTIVMVGSGAESRNINWNDSRRMFDASNADNVTITQLGQIRKHFNGRRGTGRSFPIRDRSFFKVTVAEALGTGTGALTTFQLTLNDGDSGNAYNREIYLPENGTISIFDNATPVVEGAGAGKFTLAYSGATAGLVTFGTAPVAGHVLTWTGQFYLPVRYTSTQFPSSDTFIWRADNTGLAKGPKLEMIEVRYTDEF